MTESVHGEAVDVTSKRVVLAYMSVTGLVLVLLMLFGLLMRLSQGGTLQVPDDLFYQVMTAHGIGMVGISGLGGAAILWYFLRQYVRLSKAILITNLIFFLIGVVLVLGGTFIGGFAGAWTFLYPLPAKSAGVWVAGAAAAYLVGVLLVGVGFLLLFLDIGRAILSRYGGLGRALGWPQLFGGDTGDPPPPTVVASTVVTIMNVLAIGVGAVILTISLVNLYVPGFSIDALLAKNLIYFFGHTFINATIYMAIVAVYEILPRYTGRPWPATKVFLAAWSATLVMVLIVYPHHLLMDFVMPTWMLWMGQIISYTSGFPVLVVTAIGTLTIVYRSAIQWDLASGLLFLSVFGWAAGVLPAIIDATIVVNLVMHNTMWVPGHFHFYLLLGLVAMFFGFMYYLAKGEGDEKDILLDRAGFWIYTIAGLAFIATFLMAGKDGVARRWAVHLPEWVAYDRLASVFGTLVILAVLVFVIRFLTRLRAMGAFA
ncbi:MAG: cbb3-type cytochrome c oxidase subunit I [Gammaproteobacteria bacterium]